MNSLSRISILLILLMGMLGFAGCAASSQQMEAPTLIPVEGNRPAPARAERSVRVRNQEAPQLYHEGSDDWTPTWNPVIPKRLTSDPGAGKSHSLTSTAQDSNGVQVRIRQVQGYRVQLANVMSEDQAKSIESRATALFDAIYITFRSPNYKVRAGDFQRRSDADQAAEEARRLGFRGAWVVPDRINVKE